MNKVDSVIKLDTSLDKLFELWLTFLRPFHNLAKREIEVAASLLRYRYDLSKKIIDDDMLNLVLMSEDSRKHLMLDCNMKALLLLAAINTFKKVGLIVDNKVNPRFIPRVLESKGSFTLLLYFKINESE